MRSLLLLLLFLTSAVAAQQSTIREVNRIMTTYPFSDPDPVVKTGRIYPYFGYDGFTNKPVAQSWRIVELENDYIRLAVMPELGGKVWEAFEKSENYPFIFTTKAVKFRDIALRGPWTTGGLEFNFGDIGHGTTVSTPVDYFARTNADGSVSCFIGATDWASGTTWRVEIKLDPDKAYFTTHSWWYNDTPVEQEYYHWINAGFKANGDLEFIFPGTHHIGHGGIGDTWPLDSLGRKISFYRHNDFGSYKSYHIIGRPSNFYGGYWHADDMGFGRYSPYYEKLGKKVWILGLSQEGDRWENLLGDNDGLNVELQSGRLFNQASRGSELTPFKHVGFAPYTSDTWSDKWFPVKHTRGMTHSSPRGVLNIRMEGEWLKVDWMALEKQVDSLIVSQSGKIIIGQKVILRPMELFRDSVRWHGNTDSLLVRIGSDNLTRETGQPLNRPIVSPENFDWNSEYGLLVMGTDLGRQKNYREAEQYLLRALEKNPNMVPALTQMSQIRYRQGLYDEASMFAGKALSVNTYDAEANYFWGLSCEKTGHQADALDGYSVAALSPSVRRAAYLRLAWMAVGRKEWYEAERLTDKCLESYPPDELGWNIKAVLKRKMGDDSSSLAIINAQLMRDPMNHISRFEKYMNTGSESDKTEFVKYIRQELPHETFIELALQYHEWNLDEEALIILGLSPVHPMVQVIQSFLLYEKGERELSLEKLRLAMNSSPELIFPFRQEMAVMFSWADKLVADWKWRYYEALIYWQNNRIEEAKKLFSSCGDQPDYVPFYLARAELFREQNDVVLKSLEKAYNLDPSFWRSGLSLVRFYTSQNQPEKALEVAAANFKNHSGSFITGLQYAQMLKLNKMYPQALQILGKLEMLPAEGDVNAHTLFRETNILYAIEHMRAGRWKKAVVFLNDAERWPENLFSGEPYFPDNRVTQFMRSYCFGKLKIPAEIEKSINYIINYKNPDGRTYSSGNRLTELVEKGAKDYEKITSSVLNDLERDRDKDVLKAFLEIL
jgi:tetratricopeptide (TPR) repeat protein